MEKEFKGTPGPWRWDGNPCKYDKKEEAPRLMSGKDMVLTGEIDGHNEHDMALIAAAPELLQACMAVENTLRTMISNPASDLLMSELQSAINSALNIK